MKGSCLCGAIEISTADQNKIDVCHCSMCRRWGGGPMFAVHCGPNVTFSGTQKPVTYRSSDWAERGFCPVCGTHLFYHLRPVNQYILSAGIFEEETSFEMRSQIFIDHKPNHYDFANKTPVLTEEQVFSQYEN